MYIINVIKYDIFIFLIYIINVSNVRFKSYKSYKIENFKNIKKIISYFERLLNDVENLRESVEDGFLQNQIDTIEELINSTLYKLKYLND